MTGVTRKIEKMLEAARSWLASGKPEDAHQAAAAISRAEHLIEQNNLDRRRFRFPGDPPKPTMNDIPIYTAEDIARQAKYAEAGRRHQRARPNFDFAFAAAAAGMSQADLAAAMRRVAEQVRKAQDSRFGKPNNAGPAGRAKVHDERTAAAGRRETRRPMSGTRPDRIIIDDPWAEPIPTKRFDPDEFKAEMESDIFREAHITDPPFNGRKRDV